MYLNFKCIAVIKIFDGKIQTMKTDFFKKNKKILMITVACVLVVCVGIAVIGANLSDGNGYGNMEEKLGDVICNGVSVGGIQVGGMTKA